MKRVVFDLDETICRHSNRDYTNAAPIAETIERMREMREAMDCEIVIHTSRGMKSCNGDAAKADAQNRAVTEDWLKRHGVPYDTLVFGKPFADAYIDDKSVSLEEWQKYGATHMAGGYSGKPVTRVGRIVVKNDKGGAQRDWYAKAAGLGLRTLALPLVISWSFDRLFLRYVDGHNLASAPDDEVLEFLPQCAADVREMGSRAIDGENDVLEYARLVGERATLAKMDERRLGELLDMLYALRILRRRTFCHGDFTPQNIIRSDDKSRLYLIDPSFKQFYSTYLLDAAKFRACLRGMTRVLDSQWDYRYPQSLAYWDTLWTPEEAEAIRVLERTHLVRVAGLAREKGDHGVADALLELEMGA